VGAKKGSAVDAGVQGNAQRPTLGREVGHALDVVEAALADALTKASAAGEWTVVATLARELEARRAARAGVVRLDAARRRRDGR